VWILARPDFSCPRCGIPVTRTEPVTAQALSIDLTLDNFGEAPAR
jgi:hypothetical protein